jgi:hypothetical protein
MFSIFDAIGNDTYVPDETGYKKELQVRQQPSKPSVQRDRELRGCWGISHTT